MFNLTQLTLGRPHTLITDTLIYLSLRQTQYKYRVLKVSELTMTQNMFSYFIL